MMRLTFVYMLIAMLLVTGCTYVDPLYRLQNTHLEFNKDITLEQAFKRYPFFLSTKWETIGSGKKSEVIEIESVLDLTKCPVGMRRGDGEPGDMAEEKPVADFRLVFQWIERRGKFILSGFGNRYVLDGKPVDDIKRIDYENREAFRALRVIYIGSECVR